MLFCYAMFQVIPCSGGIPCYAMSLGVACNYCVPFYAMFPEITCSVGVPSYVLLPVLSTLELTVRKPISALGCKPNATGELPCSVASMWSKICRPKTSISWGDGFVARAAAGAVRAGAEGNGACTVETVLIRGRWAGGIAIYHSATQACRLSAASVLKVEVRLDI